MRRIRFGAAAGWPGSALLLLCYATGGTMLPLGARAQTITANSSSSLATAIAAVNAGTDTTINLTGSFALTSAMPALVNNATILGNGNTIDGGGAFRPFFIGNGGTAITVSIQNATLLGGAATGGAGGGGQSGGGGGMGAGGAIFVNTAANVTLTGVSFTSNAATGGAGGTAGGGAGYGAGGGMGGAGGTGGPLTGDGGGGGGGGGLLAGTTGQTPTGATGGDGSGGGGGGGGGGNSPTTGGAGSSNGLQQANSNGTGGTGGSGGGQGGPGGSGGSGGFGGGGGGGGQGLFEASGGGGAGGFGGGGGAGSFAGTGGFGGGGGGSNSFAEAGGGTGGGQGSPNFGGDGGGGAGFGGAVFVATGGSVTMQGAGTFTGGSAAGGAGGGNGAGNGVGTGSDVFGMTGATTVLAPGTGNTITSNGTIADDTSVSGSGAGLTLAIGNLSNAGGTVVLNGANTYSGGTTVTGSGTMLQISADNNVGAAGTTVALNPGTTLAATQSFTFGHNLTIAGDPTINVGLGQNMTVSNPISDGSSSGSLALAGGGTLTLTATNTYTGATTINAGTLALSGFGSINDSSGLNLTASGATFDISGTSFGANVNGLTGVAGSTVSLGGQALGIDIADSSATNTFAGTIQDGGIAGGTGGNLFVDGPGTLVLSGNNTFTGGIVVSAGTLSISSDSNLGNGGILTLSEGTTLAVTAGGTYTHDIVIGTLDPNIDVSSGQTVIWSGVISEEGGPGQITLTGPGTLVLTADNTYTGGTTISAGTLQLGNGGTTGSVIGDIEDDSVLVFDHSDTVTFSNVISGMGSMTQAGSGTLILTGTNTYTGGTTISAGVLQIGDGTTVGSIQGDVTDNALLVFDHSDTVTYGNTISGTGALTQAGSGTLVFTQANTYTGATTISAGTLALTGSGSIANSSGVALINSGTNFDISDTTAGATVLGLTGVGGSTVSLGAQTLTVNLATGSDTFAGVIQDGGIGGGTGGSLTKSGGGMLALSNTNTYTGLTTISGGTLALVGTGSIASISGVSLSGSGTLDVSDLEFGYTAINGLNGTSGTTVSLGGDALDINVASNTTNTFAGTIQDGGIVAATGGSLYMFGPGTLILSGTNTYTGGTTISGGTLQIGAGGTTGSIIGNVTDNAALVFDRSDTVTFPGIVSGSGGLAQAGSGTLILTNANTYTGGTTIRAGTLQIGAGGTAGSIVGNVTDNAALVFDRSDTVTFAGVISGGGTLSQSGSGTLLLNGVSSGFTGSSTVAAGMLVVGDAADPGAVLGGNVTVNPGTTLRGHGTIGGNVTNNGTVFPGSSIGILTVGSYTQPSAGTLTIEITPNVGAGPGVGYDQLKVNGTASLAGALSIIDDPGTYVVGSRYTLLNSAGLRSGTFATVAYSPLFADYITPVISYDPNDVYLTLDAVTLPPGAQQVPDMLTSMVSAMEGVGDVVLGDVCGPAAQRMVTQGSGCVVRPLDNGMHGEVWMRGLGGLGSLTGGGGRVGFNDSYSGVLVGAGIGEGGFVVGAGGGYLGTTVNFSDGTNASQSAGLGFVYGRYAQGPMWFGAMAAYGGGRVDGSRSLPGTGLTATGNRSANFGIVQARAAYDLPMGAMTLEPRATFAYVHAGQAGFSESGAGFLDLAYAGSNADVTEGRLALRVMQGFSAGSWALLPWAEAGVQETFSGLARNVTATDGLFTSGVSGVSPAPTSAVVSVGLTASATPMLDLFLAYQGQFSANQTDHQFSGGLTFRF